MIAEEQANFLAAPAPYFFSKRLRLLFFFTSGSGFHFFWCGSGSKEPKTPCSLALIIIYICMSYNIKKKIVYNLEQNCIFNNITFLYQLTIHNIPTFFLGLTRRRTTGSVGTTCRTTRRQIQTIQTKLVKVLRFQLQAQIMKSGLFNFKHKL